MISRRLLRIKALMALYAFNRRQDDDLPRAEKELLFSIEKTYDLYFYILLLLVELSDIAADRIEKALHKKMPTSEDLNPNMRFADNVLISQIRNNSELKKYVSSFKLSWVNYSHVPRTIYNALVSWDPYQLYMTSPENDYSSDKKIILKLVNELLPNSEDLAGFLEEQSIYWNDDLEYVLVMIAKTLKKFKSASDESVTLMPLYKNHEDEEFVKQLFRKAVLHSGKNSEIIENNTTNWEIERIALMDILVMQLAVTEIMEFPEIPVKVSLNEYIEIAKYYCTAKSSTFVNGILDNIVKEIREKGLFNKFGRGLVGEFSEEA